MGLISTVTTKINQTLTPHLLRYGLSSRSSRLLRSQDNVYRDSILKDFLCLLPLSQSLLSEEIRDLTQKRRKELIESQKEERGIVDEWFDSIWDKYLDRFAPPSQQEDERSSNQPLRLSVMEDLIRSALLPTERYSDLERWQHHPRVTKWLRAEFLLAKHQEALTESLFTSGSVGGSSKAYHLKNVPMLSRTFGHPMAESLHNTYWGKEKVETVTGGKGLVSVDYLIKALHMKDWYRSKAWESQEEKSRLELVKRGSGTVHTIPGGGIVPIMNYELDLSKWSLEDVLELAGCRIKDAGPFNVLCEEYNIFEFWTEDYVMKLASYLQQRCDEFDGHTIILDVGAGDGTLVHFLKEAIMDGKSNATTLKSKTSNKKKQKKKKKHIPTIVATDDGSWNIQPRGSVERMSVSQAMKRYGPQNSLLANNNSAPHQLIVLCSWMPMGIDWTRNFRQAGADEYILIGECDDGGCGHNWDTWGNPNFRDEEMDTDGADNQLIKKNTLEPEYRVDGFERKNMDDLSALQFSRYDSRISSLTQTVSFRTRRPNCRK